MIKQVHIRNFKSLEDVSVFLDPVTVLIGRSGSGKSNFVDALRWLRDYLTARDVKALQQRHGHWHQVVSASAQRPAALTYSIIFAAPGGTEDFQYDLSYGERRENAPPQIIEEMLRLGNSTLFHQQNGKWVQPPPSATAPQPGTLMLGGLTGIPDVDLAHLILTRGIGCYAFSDRVLVETAGTPGTSETGFSDAGDNFLQAFTAISVNLSTRPYLRELTASLRRLKPSLKTIELEQPSKQKIVLTHEVEGRLLGFDLSQESEGFRRLLACLMAVYQDLPKQTLIFDEPEKGIYPAGLTILADEFKSYASKGRGQILLTTHSPDFLDQFAPEQIRVVEMRGYGTHIGPVAAEQLESLREHFLKPSDLLTVDEARLADSLAEAG